MGASSNEERIHYYKVSGLRIVTAFQLDRKIPKSIWLQNFFFLVSAFSKKFNLSAYHWGELTLVLGGGEVQDGEEADEVPHRGRDDPPALHCQSLARPGKARQGKRSLKRLRSVRDCGL